MTGPTPTRRFAFPAALALVLLLGWLLYLPATGGGFALDDRSNLSGLAAVEDLRSALRFTFGGTAGPLGRPLALASFLPQAEAYREGADALLRVNVLIHLLNAALLAAFLLRLGRLAGLGGRARRFAAFAATAAWLLMPLLAPASLMVVQRMATLSASFVLLALVAYLAARERLDERPRAALAGMTAAAGLGTLFAVFTKESGALLPVLLLVIEATLGSAAGAAPRSLRNFRLVVLVLPTLAILAYLALRVPYAEATVAWRDYTAWERLLSEARILWLYLARAFLPLPGSITPVNDVYAVSRSLFEPLTFVAVAAWLAALAAALAWRRRYPLAAFAVLWYTGGHLLESTVIPLELYFDHRNYLPVAGPLFAGAVLLTRLPRQPAVRTGVALYLAFLAFSLYQLTSLWGRPEVATATWYRQYPDSVRAAMRYAERQLATEGVGPALVTVNEFVARQPQHAYLLIQDLNVRCRLDPAGDYAARVAALESALGRVAATHTAGTMLSELVNVAARSDCRDLDPPRLRALAHALRDNPRYRGNPVYASLHEQLVALTYRYEGDIDRALEHLEAASRTARGKDATMLRIMTMAGDGRFAAARAAIAEARADAPAHPVRRWLWQGDLDRLESRVESAEAAAEAGR